VAGIREGVAVGLEKIKEYPYTFLYLDHNPFFWRLRTNPQFQKILARQEKTYKKRLRLYSLN
jgi:hypothetical protein